jgi:hypothetical protein
MNDSRIKKIIERQVSRLLNEAEPTSAPADQPNTASSPKTATSAAIADTEKPKGKVTRGAIGSGKVKDKVNDESVVLIKGKISIREGEEKKSFVVESVRVSGR